MLTRLLLIIVFGVVGALAWVAPPHLLNKIAEHYPETRWAWVGDGLWNATPIVTVPVLFVIGIAYGVVDPDYFWIVFFTSLWVSPFNVALDVSKYPTSHNLWPFEVAIFAVCCLPALLGGWLGKIAKQRFKSEPVNANEAR